MTEISQRFDKLAGQMSDRIAAVPADKWDATTPCEGWTARDLLDHLIDAPTGFYSIAGLDPIPDGPDRAADPQAAFEHVRTNIQASLEDPAQAEKEFDGMMGRQSFEGAVNQFICADLVIHQWDLARAVGQDDTLPADEVAAIHAQLIPADDFIRGPGIFGAKVEPPEGADDQTKFLCFLGREV